MSDWENTPTSYDDGVEDGRASILLAVRALIEANDARGLHELLYKEPTK